MHLFRIKNKEMYVGPDDPNGHHTYAVYKDKKTKYQCVGKVASNQARRIKNFAKRKYK